MNNAKSLFILCLAAFLAGCHATSVSRYQNHKDFRWRTESTEHFIIYFEAGSPAEACLPKLKPYLEHSLTRVESLLEISSNLWTGQLIHVFLVDSRPKLKALMGQEGWGNAIPRIQAIFAILNNQGNGCSTHKVCHVVANNVWGRPERWIDEGLVTYSDDRTRATVHRVSYELLKSGELLPLDILFQDFLKHPERVTYPAAGSFVRFIHEMYGLNKVRELWQQGSGSVPRILGQSVTILERDWHERLKQEGLRQ